MQFDFLYYGEFRTDVPSSEINDETVGNDLVALVVEGLRRQGTITTKVELLETTHYIECDVNGSSIGIMIGPDILCGENGHWSVQPQSRRTDRKSTKAFDRSIRELLIAINIVLHEISQVRDIRWYPSFDAPHYLALMPRSETPIPPSDYGENIHPLILIHWRLNQLNEVCFSPIGIVMFLMIQLTLLFAAPSSLIPKIMGSLFIGAVGMIIVFPIGLSILASNAAKVLNNTDTH